MSDNHFFEALQASQWHIRFPLAVGQLLCAVRDDSTVMEITYSEGTLCAALYFSVRKTEPLCLRGTANPGDIAEIVYRPYRTELYINGVLCDEEWPFSDPLWHGAALTAQTVTPEVLPMPNTVTPPAVMGTFQNAEGWRPGGGVFVGDCMPYEDDGRYHVLYLYDRHHHRSKWGLGAHQWDHISTDDFVTWQMHPRAVEIDDPMEGSICTGSHIRVGKMHYLYYTVRTSNGTPAPIMRSVSEDGYHFKKDRSFGFTLDDSVYTAGSARDPKVVCDADGIYHMFVTTTDRRIDRGVLVQLISPDCEGWQVVGNIAESPDRAEPECPDYFVCGNTYYLIYSLHGRAHYRYSCNPFDGWITPDDDIIPCSSVPKAAIHDGRIIFTGFSGIDGYAGTMTFMEAVQRENGTLEFPV